MAPQPITPCPHELRPGTTVCLHCRRESQRRSRERRHRRLVRLGAIGAILVVAAIGVNAAFTSFPGGLERLRGVLPSAERVAPDEPADRVPASGRSERGGIRAATPREASAASLVATDSARGAGDVRPAAAVTPDAAKPLQPILAQGRSELRDSLFAIRADSTVTVFFDRPLTRTRRRDKFERLVRATLPEIYGPAVDSVLAAIPPGGLAHGADLLTELPQRGVHVALADEWTLALYPETRPGVDGPLVIRYRTMVTRNGEPR